MKKSKKLDLSIIIVNYNTKKLVSDCIKSIKKSKPKLNYEVIVIDNGSTDNSVFEIKNQESKIKNLLLLENKENLGFAKANNQGIKISEGKYKLLLNSDTKVEKGALDELVNSASEKNNVGAVGAKLLNTDGSVQASAYFLPSITRAIIHYWLGGKKYFDKYVPKGSGLIKVEALTMAAFLITPEAIKRVGYLNDKYFMYFEDLDYARELKKHNLSIYYDPKARIFHSHGASGKKLAGSKDQWKRLIPGSKRYHGLFRYYIIQFVLWSGQKMGRKLRSTATK